MELEINDEIYLERILLREKKAHIVLESEELYEALRSPEKTILLYYANRNYENPPRLYIGRAKIIDVKPLTSGQISEADIELCGAISSHHFLKDLDARIPNVELRKTKMVLVQWDLFDEPSNNPNRTAIDWFKAKKEKLFTINPVVFECPYDCDYCYMKPLRHRFSKQKKGIFLNRIANIRKCRDNVFIGSNTDLFHPYIPSRLIRLIILTFHKYNYNKCRLFFCTKNPQRYNEFIDIFDKETDILGMTLESDTYSLQYHAPSKAPSPEERINAFESINHPKKFISLEPVLKYSLDFTNVILRLKPWILFIGANSSIGTQTSDALNLKEPRENEVKNMIKLLKEAGIDVVIKNNLKNIVPSFFS
jgi:hypothetical protein